MPFRFTSFIILTAKLTLKILIQLFSKKGTGGYFNLKRRRLVFKTGTDEIAVSATIG